MAAELRNRRTQNRRTTDTKSPSNQQQKDDNDSFHDSSTLDDIDSLNAPPELAVYFSHDAIENLRLRVTLRRQPQDDRIVVLERPRTVKALNLLLRRRANAQLHGQRQTQDLLRMDEQRERLAEEQQRAGPFIDRLGRRTNDMTADQGLNTTRRSQQQNNTNAAPDLYAQQIQIFEWQQKIHSPRSYLLHTHPKYLKQVAASAPHITPLHAQYVQQLRSELQQQYGAQINIDDAARQYVQAHIRSHSGMSLFTQCEDDAYIDAASFTRRIAKMNLDSDSEHHLQTNRRFLNSAQSVLNPLARRIVETPMNRRSTRSHITKEHRYSSFFIVAQVDFDLSQEQNEEQAESMRSLPRIESLGYEHVLCELKYYHNGALEMRPPLSQPLQHSTNPNAAATASQQQSTASEPEVFDDTEWYEFYTPLGTRYRYRIENVSNADQGALATQLEAQEQAAQHAAAAQQSQSIPLPLTHTEFDSSPASPHVTTYTVFAELQAYIHSSLSSLHHEPEYATYLSYELYLPRANDTVMGNQSNTQHPPPSRWRFNAADRYRRRRATTQISQPLHLEYNPFQEQMEHEAEQQQRRHQSGNTNLLMDPHTQYEPEVDAHVCQFGFPCEWTLDHEVHDSAWSDEQTMLQPSSTESLRGPVLYLQVNSVDRWRVHRVIGYTHVELPLTPGSTTRQLATWTPCGSIRATMKDWLVGGSTMLRDMKLASFDDQLENDAEADLELEEEDDQARHSKPQSQQQQQQENRNPNVDSQSADGASAGSFASSDLNASRRAHRFRNHFGFTVEDAGHIHVQFDTVVQQHRPQSVQGAGEAKSQHARQSWREKIAAKRKAEQTKAATQHMATTSARESAGPA